MAGTFAAIRPAVVISVLLWSPFTWADKPSKYVRWSGSSGPPVVTVLANKTHNIRLGWPPLRIEIVGFHDVSITFSCFVNRLREEDPIKEVKFCFGTTRDAGKGRCWELDDSKPTLSVGIGDGGKIPVTLRFYRDQGVQAELQRIPSSMSLSETKLSCRVSNRQGSEDSNDVEIFDYRQQYPPAPATFNQSSSLDPDKARRFQCLPKTLSDGPKAVVNYVWMYCSDGEFKECKNILDIRKSDWSVQIFANGTLCWSYVPPKVVKELEGKRLKCSIGDQDIARYTHPMRFKKSFGSSHKTSTTPIYPDSNPKIIKVLNGDPGRFSLPLVFDGNINKSLKWRQGRNPLKHLRVGESAHGKCYLKQNSNSPECQGPFPKKFERVEAEEVVETNRGKRSHKGKKFCEYEIQRVPLGPEISPDMPGTIFMMDGSTASVICRFKDPETVISMLSVRGYALDFNTQKTLTEDLDYLNRKYSREMSPLRASVNVTRPKYGEVVEYKLVNVSYRNPDHNNLSSDHYITCLGYRKKKWVRRQIILTVLPYPQIIGIKNRTGYNESLIYYVDVKNKDDIKKLGAELTFEWKVNGRPADSDSELVEHRQKVRANYSCVVKLENPTVSKSHESRTIFRSKLLYVTLSNPEVNDKPFKMALIIGVEVVIAVVVAVVIAVVIARRCVIIKCKRKVMVPKTTRVDSDADPVSDPLMKA